MRRVSFKDVCFWTQLENSEGSPSDSQIDGEIIKASRPSVNLPCQSVIGNRFGRAAKD